MLATRLSVWEGQAGELYGPLCSSTACSWLGSTAPSKGQDHGQEEQANAVTGDEQSQTAGEMAVGEAQAAS